MEDSVRIATVCTGIFAVAVAMGLVRGRWDWSIAESVLRVSVFWLVLLLFIGGMYWITKLHYERRDRRRGEGNQG